MRIRHLELNDVRQFSHKSFVFEPGFNLLVGENGAGKSTVLRSLATVLGHAGNFKSIDRLSDEDIRHRSDGLRVRVEYQTGEAVASASLSRGFGRKSARTGKIPTTPKIWFGANESVSSTLKGQRIRQYRNREDKRYWDREEFLYREEFFYSEEFLEPPHESELQTNFGQSQIVRRFVGRMLATFSPKFHRFGWRFSPYDCAISFSSDPAVKSRTISEFTREAQAEIMRLVQYDYPPGRHRGWGTHRVLRFDSHGRPLNKKQIYRSMPELGEILRSVSRRFKVVPEIEKAVIELRLSPRIVIFGEKYPLLLSQLSDGEKRIFSMLVDIARQLSLVGDGWRDIERKQGIVVIDEIDCHLHPKWQRMIVPTLEELFPACQIIATTHSPFVIQSAHPEKLVRLDGTRLQVDDPAALSIEDIVEFIQGVEMPQRSQRAERMSHAAERYFGLLRRGRRNVPQTELREAEVEYRKASEPFTNEPGLNALLRVESYFAETNETNL